MGEWFKPYSNPVALLAVLILGSVIALIGAAVLGIDHGVLSGMGRTDFARGLITYLFAIVTIGIAVALVLSALINPQSSPEHDARFQQGKEILALLLGVFGTMVGFYFGSETVAASKAEQLLQVSTLDIAPQPVSPTGSFTFRGVVRGGTAPYRFGAAQGSDKVDLTDVAGEGGWIVKQLQLKTPKPGESQYIHLLIQDGAGKQIEQYAAIKVTAP